MKNRIDVRNLVSEIIADTATANGVDLGNCSAAIHLELPGQVLKVLDLQGEEAARQYCNSAFNKIRATALIKMHKKLYG